ncbi:MAG: carbohydrate kinase family protein [Nanoarchaeota archaeon]|nr:carbohydrate kinase family protein [Nanoarchaeota archaeon]
MDVLVVGDINVDVINLPTKKSAPQVISEVFLVKGGEAFNFACAASRLGLKVEFQGAVGRDFLGDFLIKEGRRYGVRMKVVRKGRTGITMAITRDDRKFITYRGSNSLLKFEDIRLRKAKWFYLGGFWHLESLDHEKLFEEIRDNVALNVGYPTGKGKRKLLSILPKVDLLFLNEQEYEALNLKGFGGTMVLHMGRKGSKILDGPFQPAYRVRSLNPTGAGDVFNAAFLFGIMRGYEVEHALKFANAAAALHVSNPPDFVPTYEEVVRFMEVRR